MKEHRSSGHLEHSGKASLPDLTPTCMTLELADRSISKPMGIAKDISVKVLLKDQFVLIESAQIDVIDMACEEYSQESCFTDIIASWKFHSRMMNQLLLTSFPTLTPMWDSDFLLLEEVDSFLGLADDPDVQHIIHSTIYSRGDILF
ncbi:hypothetical protein Tco_0743616 [Tanacetum coccineum]